MSSGAALDQIDLVLIDGDNLLHLVRGSRDEGGVAWLLPHLRTWRPGDVRIIVALDGHAAPGEARRTRATRGIEFHHSGPHSADDLIINLLSAQPYAGRSRTAVVTQDRGLQDRARQAGGTTRSVDWLVRQLGGGTAGSAASGKRVVGIGQGKPPREPRAAAGPQDERDGWQPGRGATRKRGNPRRSPKGSRRR